ncbi:hypothetical protein [Novipirellula artificiosorum]|nr:hypothetical protein [Novipirellula artificiosorum]
MVLPVVLFSALCLQCGNSFGQMSDSDRSRMVEQIRSAEATVQPDRFPDLASAKRSVSDASNVVRSAVYARTDAENAKAWLDYLDLEPVAEAMEDDQSTAKLASAAFELRHRLVGNVAGLEIDVIRDLRASVEDLISAIRFRDPEKSVEPFRKQLASLADRMEGMGRVPSAEDAAAISAIVGLIDESNQAGETVAVIRQIFGRPNLAIHVGESMVTRSVNRAVNESRPVRDCILGTRIVGDATTQGAVTANLLPAMGSARIQVALTGHVTTKSLGYNGPVRLRTTGHGDVSAIRTLHVNEQGVTMEPVFATVALKTNIDAIEHRLGIVRRIAQKRAAEQKPQADRIAVAKMQQQVGSEFAQQTSEATAIEPPDLSSRIAPILKRLSLEEPARLWGSTDDAIFVDATFRRSDQIASVVSRPPIRESFELAIQVQESMVDNALGPFLAGRTINEREINELLKSAGRPPTSDGAEGDERDDSFELDFARVQPIVFEARDGAIRIGLRGTRFAQGKQELKVAMEITAKYRPARTLEGRWLLLRDQDVGVDFPGRKRLSLSQTGLKRNIQKKFTDVFPETLLDRTLEVPSSLEVEVLRGRQFRPTLIEAQDGWLTIAVR